MGFMTELKRLARPYAEDEDEFEDFDDGFNDEPAAAPSRPARSSASSTTYDFEALGIGGNNGNASMGGAARSGNKIVNINATTQLKVVLVRPERFDNVSEIAEHLREKHAVVLNLEQTSKDISRRLVDFLSGCAYALDGKIKKIAISTYLITPYNVEFEGDLAEELENNGMYL